MREDLYVAKGAFTIAFVASSARALLGDHQYTCMFNFATRSCVLLTLYGNYCTEIEMHLSIQAYLSSADIAHSGNGRFE